MAEIREEYASEHPIVISGCVGPQGDGYSPATMLTPDEAQRYHSTQIATFADTAADMVTAITMTYAEEAIGLARAAVENGLPVAISFTLETDGRLPSGQALGGAIQQVDEETSSAPAYYMINCAHPTHFEDVLEPGAPWVDRIGGLRANASTKSHAELDEATELDEGDPADLGERHAALRTRLPRVNVLGGCCGTDHRHVTSICTAWLAEAPARTVENRRMRVSAKVDYALRALAELAAAPPNRPVKGEQLANAQDIPLNFLENILLELRRSELVASRRGAEGGYWLGRPAAEISLADVVRAVEGPIASVRGSRPEDVTYTGAATALQDVWIELARACATCSRRPRSQTSPSARRRLAEDAFVLRAEIDDLILLELELLAAVTRHLRPELLAVGTRQLDPHLETQVDDPLDHRLVGAVGGLDRSSRSCGRTQVSPTRLTGPMKLMTNSVFGSSSRSRGPPTCSILPLFMTAMRSATSIASS